MTIHLGTNDIGQGQTPTSTESELDTMLDRIYAVKPGVKVFLANLIPIVGWYGDHNYNNGSPLDVQGRAEALTSMIPNLVSQQRQLGRDIHLVDVNSGFTVDESDPVSCPAGTGGDPTNMSLKVCEPLGGQSRPDGIHPGLLGERHIADRFFAAMQSEGICGGGDTEAPVASIGSPANNATVSAPVTINGTASDNDIVDRVEIVIRNRDNGRYWNGNALQDGYARVDATLAGPAASRTWSYTFDPGAGARYYVTALAYDGADNVADRPTRVFRVTSSDSTAPTAAIAAPVNGATVSAPTTISGTAGDDAAVSSIELVIRNIDTGQYWNGSNFGNGYARVDPSIGGSPTSRTWSYSFDPGAAAGGRYFVTAIVFDTSGNIGDRPSRRFNLTSSDTTPPDVTLAAPANNATVAVPVTASGSASDDTSVSRVELVIRNVATGQYWNGSAFSGTYARAVATLSGPASSPSWSLSFDPGVDGRYYLAAYAVDGAGNLSGRAFAFVTIAPSN